MNDLLLKALRCEPVFRPPIWLMRQTGRYLPAYRKFREKHSFRELITTPSLAAHITQLPLPMGVDAAILFSDILVIAEVFGFTVDFTDTIHLLEPAHEIELPVAATLSYVPETIRLLKKDLTVPLIGFCGGPYTVSTYMKKTTPEWLDKITTATLDYLHLQIQAGVDVIQIFDSWAGTLDPTNFRRLALPYLKTLVDGLRPTGVPVILFCRGSCRYVEELAALQPTAIGFDWENEMHLLRQKVPESIAIQGNLNPAILKGPLEVLQEKAKALLDSMKGERGYVFNLGHGVEPDTPVGNVRWLIDLVKNF